MRPKTYWWKEARIYELYIDKFAINIKGLTARLDYFTALGINCLHILPHYPSPMIDDGYDITDYRNVRAELGNLNDFQLLLDQAHARGIRIIIDFVLNHTSNQHPWFLQASASKDNPTRDYYLWSDTPYGFEGATNAFPDITSSNWIYNQATNDYYFATFYPQQPDLNWDNPEVVREMLANMDFWVGMGVDGFRLDAAPYLIKREHTTSKNLPETHAIIQNIRAHLEQKHPDVILLAEVASTVEITQAYFGNGDECQMAYHFPLMEQLWLAIVSGNTDGVQAIIEESYANIPDNCQWATFLRNHDEIALGMLSETDRTLIVDTLDPLHQYPFNKNTTTSVRVATALHNDAKKILTAFEMLYMLPGAPIMYYGDEIGMQNLPVQAGIIDTRIYVRGPFDWVEAERQMHDPDSLWSGVQSLIKSTGTS
jgi:trehalose synthase